jgi:homoserine dehydrogenase
MSPDPFTIGLLGHGTVGSAFAGLLTERAGAIERVTGRRPALGGVLTRSQGDADQILAGSDLVVELMGGVDPARELVVRALAAGTPVVTANKQLVSRHGPELAEAAAAGGTTLRFEAAIAGVVPVVRVLGESLAGARVDRIHGIVNGTTNFILSAMAATGEAYVSALKEAQELGYAEADPTEDVSGGDAAAKMAILARLAFGQWVHLDDVVYEGIEHLTVDDMAYARDFDLALKLVGTAERLPGDSLSVRVHPAFLPMTHPLASVEGAFNAVTIESPAITEITLSGPGAGGPQTASAVLGDVVSIMSGAPSLPSAEGAASITTDIESAFYLHLEVADRPGVLAQVAERLGLQAVSVKSVIQEGLGGTARLVIVTHPVLESRFGAALELISALDFMRAAPRAIRVIDETFEA